MFEVKYAELEARRVARFIKTVCHAAVIKRIRSYNRNDVELNDNHIN